MDYIMISGIVVIVVGVILVIISLLIGTNTGDNGLRNILNKNVLDGDGMINPRALDSVTYFYGGGELGDIYRVTISVDNTVCIESCEGNGQPHTENVIKVERHFLETLEDIADENAIRDMDNLKESDIMMLDGSYVTLDFDFTDGKQIHINTERYIMDEKATKVVHDIIEVLEEATGNKIAGNNDQ